MLKGAVVLISLLAVAAAYLVIVPLALPPKPDRFKDQEGCYIPKLDQVVPFGQSAGRAPRGEELCESFTCDRDHVKITGCEPTSSIYPCTVTVTRNKTFPDCCPQVHCHQPKKTTN